MQDSLKVLIFLLQKAFVLLKIMLCFLCSSLCKHFKLKTTIENGFRLKLYVIRP